MNYTTYVRDKVKAERKGGQGNTFEGTDDGNTTATLSNIQEYFKKYVNNRMSLIEKSLKHLSSQADKISSSADQVAEYSNSYNIKLIKLVGIPELKQRESAMKHCKFA